MGQQVEVLDDLSSIFEDTYFVTNTSNTIKKTIHLFNQCVNAHHFEIPAVCNDTNGCSIMELSKLPFNVATVMLVRLNIIEWICPLSLLVVINLYYCNVNTNMEKLKVFEVRRAHTSFYFSM